MEPNKPYISQEWLDYEATIGGRFCLEGDIDNIRRQIQELMKTASGSSHKQQDDSCLLVKDFEANGIPVRMYQPLDNNTDAPVCIFSHGGGWCLGDLDSEDNFCRRIAKSVPCTVVSVEYRLGPLHKLPTMLEDVVAVYTWICDSANGILKDSNKFFALGGSAGGANSLALCNYVAENIASGRPMRKLDGVVAIAPVTLHPNAIPSLCQERYHSYRRNSSNVPLMDAGTMMTYFDAVNAVPDDARIFTGLSKHHALFPNTFIAVGGADPLEDDGILMTEMLSTAGVRTRLDLNPGMPHMFWIFEDFPHAQAFSQRLLEGIKFVLADS